MKEKLLVIFSRNKDRKTANLFVDGFLISQEIPYIPTKAVDHRGNALYFFAMENSLKWADFELDELTETPSEIKRGWDYMFQPSLIAKAIKESNLQRHEL
jgi:hypothetical protein